MITSGSGNIEGKRNSSKFFVSSKDNKNSMVVVADSEADAMSKWCASTGRKKSDASARKIGSRAETITREIKPKKHSDMETK